MAKHYIITNREIASFPEGPGNKYIKVNSREYMRIDGNEEAKDELRYGTVSFDPSSARSINDFSVNIYEEFSEKSMQEYAMKGKVPAGKEIPSRIVFTDLYEKGIQAKKNHVQEHILVFIHGFKSDLKIALTALKELHNKYVANPESPVQHIVMFTWPAKSKALRYRDDARDAVKSGYALARSFASMKEFFRLQFVEKKKKMCEQKIHLMCHSMGNRVLESMFAALNEMNIEPNSTFGEIFLVGADIDYDALHRPKPMYRIIDVGERVHIYYHNNDQALGISEYTKNAFNRLGRWGVKNTLDLPDDVYQANVSDINDDSRGLIDKIVHHWYHYNSPSVVRDISEVMNGKSSTFTLL